MTTADALRIAASHGATIGRRRPGLYYVTWAEGGAVREQEIAGKHMREAVKWIEANLAARKAA